MSSLMASRAMGSTSSQQASPLRSAGLFCSGFLFSLLGCMLVLYAPNMRLGGGATSPSATADIVIHQRGALADSEALLKLSSLQAAHEKLITENKQLQEALKRTLETSLKQQQEILKTGPKAGAAASESPAAATSGSTVPAAVALDLPTCRVEPTTIQIDLVKLLGPEQFVTGISYDPYVCYPGLADPYPESTEEERQAVKARLLKLLKGEMARVYAVKEDEVDENVLLFQQSFFGGTFKGKSKAEAIPTLTNDPRYQEWRKAVTRVFARFMVDAFKHLHSGGKCRGLPANNIVTIAQLGKYCEEITWQDAVAINGYFNVPFISLNDMSHVVITGTCFTHIRNNHPTYAHWLIEERMNDEWKTFNVPGKEEDIVLLLFDMMYERNLIFTKQYWMGVITMQNPFDMYSIQDIIYTDRPDVLIETGTANGGSALLWAGVMELAGLEDSKIITIDVVPPVWKEGQEGWGGGLIAREDPTQNKHWKKRVTFIEGYSTDEKVLAQVSKLVHDLGAKKVMVTLDSGHNKENVLDEMNKYCTMVSVGSYCVVEDTKMSRWHSTGPLEAVKMFLDKNPNFVMDRSRELMYTHHVMGYVKRVS